MKESFLLYKSFYEPIKHLTLEQKGALLDAIFLYQLGQDVTEVTAVNPAIKMAFEFFKNQFRLDDNKYQTFVELQKEKGRKSAERRWGKDNKKVTTVKPVNPGKPSVTEITYNENENDNVIKYTKKYFKTNWEQILKEAKEEFADKPEYKNKDFDGVMKEFLMKIDIKNYGYTNYRLAYLNWVRNNYNSGVKPNGAVKSDKSKYGGR
ncbi:MAG: DUF6291 domain-containing protein [Candidatus Pacearchaeota archaeon]